jgi:cytochrome c2
MRRLAILTLLFAAPVAAQEAGEPEAGAAYAKQYCAKCHAIADEDASPEHTAPRFKDVGQYLWHDGYRVDGLASDFAPDHAQYHPRAERHE